MGQRSTANLNTIRYVTNEFLFNSRDEDIEQRWGMIKLLEKIWDVSYQYRTFTYIEQDEMKASRWGKTGGMISNPTGYPTQEKMIIDETRRRYSHICGPYW